MKIFWRIIRTIIIIFFSVTIGLVIIYKWVNPPITPLMIIRCFEQKKEGKPIRLEKKWVPIEEISPYMIQAVVAAEDNKFTKHFGFDMEAIKYAKEYNKTHKRKLGGSTISQQVAKNVFLFPDRSWVRKAFEAYFTVLIEVFWSKERIMEVYLNVIELGDGIYGVEKASEIYFGKNAKRLTKTEAATLAASLPSPRKWNPHTQHPRLYRRRDKILYLMDKIGPVELKKQKNK